MLINATQKEELRMAMVDGQRLYDLNIELPAGERKKANIYKGKITRIEPSLEAAFVDFGADRHGFLPLKEISSEYFVKPVESGKKPNIREVLKEGQDIVIQIDKEERGNKGAALTTYVSLAGRFIVLKPNKSRSGGVSRRIVGDDRDLARQSLSDVEIPKGMSVILRTAGIDRSTEELAWDLENLLTIWHAILNVVLEKPSPFLIYRESDSVVRALRDYMTTDIGEILIDDDKTYKEAVEFVEQVMPHNLRKLKHYTDPVPLFTRYQIESQIESAFSHAVTLPSGGTLVVDHTEALVSVDINSARATKGSDIEATALNTNLEAAEEIARQLRIRDLGGLIVIDFIDMGPQKNQRDVENRLRDCVRQDRARVQIGKISRFGLLEMSRQRLRPSLGESSHLTCPRCSGLGTIRSVESLALAILRIIGEEVRKERTAKVIAQLPVEVATYLLNEKREWVRNLETSNDTQVVLVANSSLETPHYDIRRVRDDQTELPENAGASYELADSEEEPELPATLQDRKIVEPAAISTIKPSTPAPKRRKRPGTGFWASIGAIFSSGEEKPKSKSQTRRRKQSGKSGQSRSPQRSRRRKESHRSADNRSADRKKTKKPAKKTSAKDKSQRTKDAGQQTRKPEEEAENRDESQSTRKKTSRGRRSRSGRRRRRTGDRPAQDSTVEQQQTQPAEDKQRVEKPAAEKPVAEKPVADQPIAEKQQARRDEPAQSEPGKATEVASPAIDNVPPKVRTDAERATDAAVQSGTSVDTDQTVPNLTPISEPVKSQPSETAESQPSETKSPLPSGNGSSDPEPKTEPKSEPETKTEPKSEPETEPKSEAKPQGSLLPWDAPAPQTVQKPREEPAKAEKPAEPLSGD
ncbi:MAG: Rne/Rng family ribonuclease [Proteobacteria bacterium]|nr:Rne/Rng family ribonuclease [Pseudomonadota bacterium]